LLGVLRFYHLGSL
jgi:hypothetical protein